MNQFTVAGISTEIGKTFISSILTESLDADYWKPIQAGALDFTDTDTVRSLVTPRADRIFFPERYRLQEPMSPHAAAARENIQIKLQDFSLPITRRPLIVELAGGLMSPFNSHQTNADLTKWLGLPVVLVSKNYLGSINHTLLTVEALRHRDIVVKGIIFNGEPNPETESHILEYTGLRNMGHVLWEDTPDRAQVQRYAHIFRENWK
jgi:dethiobiotin synthetase